MAKKTKMKLISRIRLSHHTVVDIRTRLDNISTSGTTDQSYCMKPFVEDNLGLSEDRWFRLLEILLARKTLNRKQSQLVIKLLYHCAYSLRVDLAYLFTSNVLFTIPIDIHRLSLNLAYRAKQYGDSYDIRAKQYADIYEFDLNILTIEAIVTKIVKIQNSYQAC